MHDELVGQIVERNCCVRAIFGSKSSRLTLRDYEAMGMYFACATTQKPNTKVGSWLLRTIIQQYSVQLPDRRLLTCYHAKASAMYLSPYKLGKKEHFQWCTLRSAVSCGAFLSAKALRVRYQLSRDGMIT